MNKSIEVDSKLEENVKPTTGVNNTEVFLILSLTLISLNTGDIHQIHKG